MSAPTEPELRTLFAAVTPPSTLDQRWRETAVVSYHVRSPVRLRVLVSAFVAVLVFTGGVVASKLASPAPTAPARAPSTTEPTEPTEPIQSASPQQVGVPAS